MRIKSEISKSLATLDVTSLKRLLDRADLNLEKRPDSRGKENITKKTQISIVIKDVRRSNILDKC